MLRKISLALAAAMLFILAGCAPQTQPASAPKKVQFTDALGHTVEVAHKPAKTAVMVGSYAQGWLEAGGTVAGVTEDFASNYPKLCPKDVTVLGSLKEPSLEALLELQPDFVILSPDIASHAKLDEPLTQAGIPHAYFKQESYQDYLSMLKIYTDILEEPALYTETETKITRQVEEAVKSAGQGGTPPKVLLVRGMSSGVSVLGAEHATGRILQDLHAENIADKYPSLLKEMSAELVLDENPDYILVVPMGDVDAANASFWEMVKADPLWEQVNAVKNKQVHLLPKDLFQLKPNMRWGESYEYLANLLYQKQ